MFAHSFSGDRDSPGGSEDAAQQHSDEKDKDECKMQLIEDFACELCNIPDA